MKFSDHPIIGCTTYHKRVEQARPIDVYGLMPAYTEAITAAGGIPLLIPLGLSDDDLGCVFERLDGVLLPGGGDVEPSAYGGRPDVTMWGIDPERDHAEFVLSRLAVAQRKPLFAICRGIQVFNVALGGTLWEDIAALAPGAMVHNAHDDLPRNHLAHTVELTPGSNLSKCLGKPESWVNSLHHQAIRDLAPELAVTATAPDGIIEGVEVPGHPFAVGVQWHPENLVDDDPAMLSLFKGLVAAAQ